MNGGSPRLSFARATIADPVFSSNWSWHFVDDYDGRGQYSDMLLHGGVPVIAYDGWSFKPSLFYATPSSATPDGIDDWSYHIVDQNEMLQMGFLSLIEGKPAIGYSGGEGDVSICLAQSLATDPAAGEDWQLEQLPRQDELHGFISAGGNPAYILYSSTYSRLDYFYYYDGE
jgi:hypothetical protein